MKESVNMKVKCLRLLRMAATYVRLRGLVCPTCSFDFGQDRSFDQAQDRLISRRVLGDLSVA